MQRLRTGYFWIVVLFLFCGSFSDSKAEESEPTVIPSGVRQVHKQGVLCTLWNWAKEVVFSLSRAETETASSESFKKISFCSIRGETFGLCVADGLTNHLCVAVNNSGLLIFDLNKPESPVQTGSVALEGFCINVSSKAGYAYVSAWNGGIRIIDFTQPDSPKEVAQVLENEAKVYHTTVASGNRLYAAAGEDGMFVIDISEPLKPSVVGRFKECEDVRSVVLYGDMVCICDYLQGVKLLDVTDLKNIRCVGKISEEDCVGVSFATVDPERNILCVFAEEPKITFFDVTDKSRIKKTGSLNPPGDVYAASLDHPFLYFGEIGYGIKEYDCSAVSGDEETGLELFETDSDVFDMVRNQNYFFVAVRTEGLLVLERTRK